MSAATHEALERAIREHLAVEFPDETVALTHWTLAGATMNGDGVSGFFREDSGYLDMPLWQVLGLLAEALRRCHAAGTVE